jgi:predicted nuclease of predicted toxin-antitoxin system
MMQRWLFNENVPLASVLACRAWGWDVLSIAQSHPGISDAQVMFLAQSEQRCLVTFDCDYGELIYKLKQPAPPALILLRLPSYQPQDPARCLQHLVQQDLLQEGYFHQFDGETLRRRLFPAQA